MQKKETFQSNVNMIIKIINLKNTLQSRSQNHQKEA